MTKDRDAQGFAALLGAQGPFAKEITGFRARPQQQAMADCIGAAIQDAETLILEAGTGTGKTFAYLVPALLCGGKSIVSTATKTLQDQLYHRDLPTVRRALGSGARLAVLKGRANYICRYRLARAGADPANSASDDRWLTQLNTTMTRSHSGDIGEIVTIPEDAPIWPRVTSTTDNCHGQTCPEFESCYLVRARRTAVQADVVIVNHHLLCADLVLRDEGFGELLPSADTVVVDEAHQFPEIATNFFGTQVSARQLRDLLRDGDVAMRTEAADTPALENSLRRLDAHVRALGAAFGTRHGRHSDDLLAQQTGLERHITALGTALGELADILERLEERGSELQSLRRRAAQCHATTLEFLEARHREVVRWFELSRFGYVLRTTPVSPAPALRARFDDYAAVWLFTSATLAVGTDFSHFKRQIGLEEARDALFSSPFDYSRQALRYQPEIAYPPGDPRYLDAVCGVIKQIVGISGGRAFALFTSYRALHYCAERLDGTFAYPALVQGQAPRSALLARFVELGDAVLLGTASFWEGIDVRGEALSCVIIDKLPFAPPDDPITRARARAIEDAGGNAFQDLQLPQAVLTLKQGVGRLIRDTRDRGLLVICDPRLRTKNYGQIFQRALPPMSVTADLDEVARFFHKK